MKYLLSAFSFLIITVCHGQQTGTPVLFISNQDSKLFVDGAEMSPLNVNEPFKIYLNPGDHVVQAKTANEIQSQTVSCIDSKQKVVSFTFRNDYTKNGNAGSSNPAEQLVIHDLVTFRKDVVRNFSTTENKYFSFDANDRIKFSYWLNSPGGSLNLYIYSYPANQIIYSKENITSVTDSFIIANKGVYYFSMINNNVVKTPATIKITRIPGAGSSPGFKTTVISRPDTTFTVVSEDTYTLKKNRLSVPLNIPANSRFWVYWIGIGNEAIINYDNYSKLYAEGKSGDYMHLVYAYGTGRLDALPTIENSRDLMDYGIGSKADSQNFLAGKQYNLFSFKKGKNITSDFAKVEVIKNNMHLLVSIPQASIGQKMKIVLVSFQVKENYVMDPGENL